MDLKWTNSRAGPTLLVIVAILILSGSTQEAEVLSDKEPYNFLCLGEKLSNGSTAKSLESSIAEPLIVFVSGRVTHQIVSRIYAIVLREFFHYNHPIRLQLINQTSDISVWNGRSVDLEHWLTPDYFLWHENLVGSGMVIDFGRFGWYIPKDLIETDDLPSNFPHTMLQGILPKKIFDQFKSDHLVEGILEKYRPVKIWTPKHCSERICVPVFSDSPDDSNYVENMMNHIKTFNLSVYIIWMGSNLRPAVWGLMTVIKANNQNLQERRKFIILGRTPSDVIDGSITFQPLSMPNCETMMIHNVYDCSYELIPVIKYHEKPLLDDEVQQLTRRMAFERPQYLGIIRSYENMAIGTDKIHAFNTVACDWVKSNIETIEKWSAHKIKSSKSYINIAGIFPKTDTSQAASIKRAADLAIESVNLNNHILGDYHLKLLTTNTDCPSDNILKTFINYNVAPETGQIVGILGPACSDAIESITVLSKVFRMISISYAASGTSFDPITHPYFFRTIGENKHFEPALLQIMKEFKWKKIATLSEDGQKYTEYLSASFDANMKKNNIDVLIHKKIPRALATSEEIQHNLKDLIHHEARIIVAELYDSETALRIICEAYHLDMTAPFGYVWFVPAWINKYNDYSRINCTKEEIMAALNWQFSFDYASFGADNTFIPHINMTIGQWRQLLVHPQFEDTISTKSLEYTGFVFDAVWVFAKALDIVLNTHPDYIMNLHSINATNALVETIEGMDFEGISGRIKFNDEHSRQSHINLHQWMGNETRIVAVYYHPSLIGYNLKNSGLHLLQNGLWPDQIPTDGSHGCSLQLLADGLNLDCETVTITFTILVSLIVIMMASLAFYIYWKRFYNEKIRASAKVMRSFGIDLLNGSASSENTLDKWEVPKERIIVNRKLGEGAFGTVYGGEAKIKSSNDEWTAVAVKTLKVGSTAEDRIDFLTEAEAMKRFDHRNILKLLGVCLQSEPVFTIIEFMLYGDLKTYLLARRHLVSGKISDDCDISPKRLTMMTLDISRGLAYLAEQKYVHRDIASRNCLVNADRVVKIGDFGMARPMFESDYYKFNRKGLLPVRWLSPESLGLGLFTPASDIWSFGVLVYEIITFGAFPYQGLANNEVLEFVKNGGSMSIPIGVKPPLEGLMRACWNPDYKKRPTAAELTEFILNYPRLVTPCLDVPHFSIQLTDEEGLLTDNVLSEIMQETSQNANQTIGDESGPRVSNLSRNSLDNIHFSRSSDMTDTIRKWAEHDAGSTSNNMYNPVEPLIDRQASKELSRSYNSLLRYVPMWGFGNRGSSNPPIQVAFHNNNQFGNKDTDFESDYTKMSITQM